MKRGRPYKIHEKLATINTTRFNFTSNNPPLPEPHLCPMSRYRREIRDDTNIVRNIIDYNEINGLIINQITVHFDTQ